MPSTKIDDGDRLDIAICESKRLLEQSRTLLETASGARVAPREEKARRDGRASSDDSSTQNLKSSLA